MTPGFVYGLCRVDVGGAPAHLHGALEHPFWSVAYINDRNRILFGLTNQISDQTLNVVLASKGQQRLLAEQPELVTETAVTMTARGNAGLLLVRQFVPQEIMRKPIAKAMAAFALRAFVGARHDRVSASVVHTAFGVPLSTSPDLDLPWPIACGCSGERRMASSLLIPSSSSSMPFCFLKSSLRRLEQNWHP